MAKGKGRDKRQRKNVGERENAGSAKKKKKEKRKEESKVTIEYTNRRESWQAAKRRCPNTPATLSKCDAAAGTGPAFSRSVGHHRFLAPSSCLVPHSFRLGHVNASNATGLGSGRFNNPSSTPHAFLLPPSFLPSRPLPSLLLSLLDKGFRNQLETNQLSATNIPPCTRGGHELSSIYTHTYTPR